MKLGKMLSVGEVVEQPAAEEAAAARSEPDRARPARLDASATADGDRAQVPAVADVGR